MSEINKNNIFYIPKIDYEKSYETEGRINNSIIKENNQVSENIVDEFNNTIDKINNMLNLFPNDLKEISLDHEYENGYVEEMEINPKEHFFD